MGLGPIMAIYQARFNKYLADRGIKDTSNQHVWCFLGDGECDEPETLGAIAPCSTRKPRQSDLRRSTAICSVWMARCAATAKSSRSLEGAFRGAGWNVIKVIWGDQWDPLLEKDETGLLAKRMAEVVDGEYQKYVVMPGSYIREHFFGKYPELRRPGQPSFGREAQEAQPRGARSREGICGLQVGDRNARAGRP